MSSGKRITVNVPASTSNLGSGFDTIGLAVNLFIEVEASISAERGLAVEDSSPHAGSAEALIREAAVPWLERIPNLTVRIRNEIPVGRGLGASAALRVGVTAAFSLLAGEAMDRPRLLERVFELEHHPDNASPAIFGGFTVSGLVGGQVRCLRFPVSPALRLITLFPTFEMLTGAARQLLPDSYSKADAVHSLNRAALITAAMAQQDYGALRGLFDDVLHQPHRRRLVPQLNDVIEAGVGAGAIGGFLSGAGSAIICLALENTDRISRAMQAVMPDADVRELSPINEGAALLNSAMER